MPVAISIRQPYIELILNGRKKEEYRSRFTERRGLIYLYAPLRPAKDDKAWAMVKKGFRDLPSGLIVGTVKLVDCIWNPEHEDHSYVFRNPQRIEPFKPRAGMPQPCFWHFEV